MNNKRTFISFCCCFILVTIFATTSATCANAGLVSWFFKNFSDDVAKGVVKNYGDDVARGIVKNYSDDVARGVVKNYSDDVARGVIKNYSDDVARGVVKNYSDDVARGVVKNYGDDVAKGVVKNYGDDVARELAKNYGDDVAKAVVKTYGDDVMRYATKEGAKQATPYLSAIFTGIGKIAMPVAFAVAFYNATGRVTEAIAAPVSKVLNVTADSVAPKINSFIIMLICFVFIYLLVKSILKLWHIYKIHKIKEAKLQKELEAEKINESTIEVEADSNEPEKDTIVQTNKDEPIGE